MTLEKAIEILEDIKLNDPPCWEPDANNALKLGIEALKYCEKIPCLPIRPGRNPLPGETKD